jgi:hypothetical protein
LFSGLSPGNKFHYLCELCGSAVKCIFAPALPD